MTIKTNVLKTYIYFLNFYAMGGGGKERAGQEGSRSEAAVFVAL